MARPAHDGEVPCHDGMSARTHSSTPVIDPGGIMAVMEITTYTVPVANVDALAAARPAIVEAMGELEGLERIDTVDLGDGRMVDVAVWRDAATLEAAMGAAANDERLAPLFTLIEDVDMRTGAIVT
jgi:hypothetical protein